nr:amidohydrolase family protein [Saccharopolyspora gloriosae]
MTPVLLPPVLLTGARLVDGTGTAPREADVLITGSTITAVEPPGILPAHGAVEDLTGLTLAPGFIDAHSHADNAPLLTEDDTTKILQGVTTEVVGNCGFSLAPRSTAHAGTLGDFLRRLFPPTEFTWSNFQDLFARTDAAGYVTNHCPLVGHGSLRIAATGTSDRPADDTALHAMRAALEEGMSAGAFGLSSGLGYPPAMFASTRELAAVAEVLGGDGLYATHLRDEGAHLQDSIDEALRIGQVAGRTQLSHLKAAGRDNWGAMAAALTRIARARHTGAEVLQDVYPYTASSTMLTALLPADFLGTDPDTLIARLSGKAGRAELRAELGGRDDWDDILVATTAGHQDEGRTLAELAAERATGPVDVLADLLVRERLRVAMIHFSMQDTDLRQALADEHTMIGSDGLPPGNGGKPHPRLHGTFPRVLGRYCRDLGLLSLPEAVRKMTSLPARAFRIPNRGLVAPGQVADLVAFDSATVRDVGGYRDPVHPPAGIRRVWLGGRLVVDRGRYLGGRNGRRLTPSH